MCVLEGFRFLKCVFTSRIDFSLNLVPLYTIVSKNTVSVSDISAVKFLIFEISIKKISCKDREIKKKSCRPGAIKKNI